MLYFTTTTPLYFKFNICASSFNFISSFWGSSFLINGSIGGGRASKHVSPNLGLNSVEETGKGGDVGAQKDCWSTEVGISVSLLINIAGFLDGVDLAEVLRLEEIGANCLVGETVGSILLLEITWCIVDFSAGAFVLGELDKFLGWEMAEVLKTMVVIS